MKFKVLIFICFALFTNLSYAGKEPADSETLSAVAITENDGDLFNPGVIFKFPIEFGAEYYNKYFNVGLSLYQANALDVEGMINLFSTHYKTKKSLNLYEETDISRNKRIIYFTRSQSNSVLKFSLHGGYYKDLQLLKFYPRFSGTTVADNYLKFGLAISSYSHIKYSYYNTNKLKDQYQSFCVDYILGTLIDGRDDFYDGITETGAKGFQVYYKIGDINEGGFGRQIKVGFAQLKSANYSCFYPIIGLNFTFGVDFKKRNKL